jgi:hypothetical protein
MFGPSCELSARLAAEELNAADGVLVLLVGADARRSTAPSPPPACTSGACGCPP